MPVLFIKQGDMMKIRNAIFMAAALGAIVPVQAINISGTVKNSAGAGMEGVKVVLGKAAIVATTGSNGSFTVKDNTGVSPVHSPAAGGNCPVLLENDRLSFRMMDRADVRVMAFDCTGKLLFSQAKVAPEGNVSMALPRLGSGVHIYRVFVGNDLYSFRSVIGAPAKSGPAPSVRSIGLAKQAKTAAAIDDALLFIKQGYQLTRIVVKKGDTAGVEAVMTPLDTGSMTDGEGNVYKTVKIGSQVWTSENLRASKFNDGSGIGSACNYYTGVSDAAAKRKWGAFYNWSAVKGGKLAPKGWHVPTSAEWDTLQNYLISHGYNDDGTTTDNRIGKALATTTDWVEVKEAGALSLNPGLNNASGFSAPPTGWHYWDGKYMDQGKCIYWWTATAKDGTYSYIAGLWNNMFNLDRTYYTLIEVCIRLVKDK
jgi:uncharacterized protein (TIGR02145 family)